MAHGIRGGAEEGLTWEQGTQAGVLGSVPDKRAAALFPQPRNCSGCSDLLSAETQKHGQLGFL